MALANRCDRCGAYYTRTKNPMLKLIKSRGVATDGHKIDLCDDCQKALEEFMDTDYTFSKKFEGVDGIKENENG